MGIIPQGSLRAVAARAAAAYGDVGGIAMTLAPDGSTVKFGAEGLTFEQVQMCLRTASRHYAEMQAETERDRARRRRGDQEDA